MIYYKNSYKRALMKRIFCNDFKTTIGSYSVGMDCVFQNYFLENNMPEKITRMRECLDERSRTYLTVILHRMILLPDMKVQDNFVIKSSLLESLQTDQDRDMIKSFAEALPQIKKDIISNSYEASVFHLHHGLKKLSDKAIAYTDGKDFIDGGAFDGGTAIVLSKYYSPKKIWSFDISSKNIELYNHYLNINNVETSRYQLVQKGLGKEKQEMYFNDTGEPSTNLYSDTKDNKCFITDLDSFVSENNLVPGFIKCDIEGFMLDALEGMAQTIKRHRPILSFAIYHNATEFFETAPKLYKIVDDYIITLVSLAPFNYCNVEITIVAYPKEIDD